MIGALASPSIHAEVTWTAWSPTDPRWYEKIGGTRSDAGFAIVPESALRIAAVYRAVNVLAHSVASIPFLVYQRLDDDGKERAREHPAFGLLRDKPNAWQTSFRWRHLMMVQAILWGEHYSEIIPGPGGIRALHPMNPDTTRLVEQLPDGRLVYVTQDVVDARGSQALAPERVLIQDEVLHVRGFSIDGKRGIALTKLARNAMGLALSAERHGSMFLRKGARLAGFLSSPSAMQPETRKENEKAWQRQYGGSDASGSTPLLTGGMEYKPIGTSNRDSQWLEAREFQVQELLRFMGVPGVMVGFPDKSATYASAEQFFQSFVTHSVQPWTENIRTEVTESVVVGAPDFYADFILEGLLKGDIKTRYDSHRLAISSGWKTRNEVRVAEGMNRGPDELDTFLEPLNMVEAGAEREGSGSSGSAGGVPSGKAPARLESIAEKTVARLVRKELVALLGDDERIGHAVRFASEPKRWAVWLAEFYADHEIQLVEELGISRAVARWYCAAQRSRLQNFEPVAIESLEADSSAALLRLTLNPNGGPP